MLFLQYLQWLMKQQGAAPLLFLKLNDHYEYLENSSKLHLYFFIGEFMEFFKHVHYLRATYNRVYLCNTVHYCHLSECGCRMSSKPRRDSDKHNQDCGRSLC